MVGYGKAAEGVMRMLRHCLDCGVLIHGGSRCPAHQRAYAQRRGTRQQQGYGAEWQRIRLIILERDDYLCRYCGCPATTVDHVIQIGRAHV